MDREQGLRDWPDKDLVVAYKGGVPEAYDEMYRRYSARIYGVCRRMLANPDDAREATQETFLKAYQALPRFNGQYKLGAWLGRIATNVCVDHIRRRTRGAIMTPLDDNYETTDLALGPEDMVVKDEPALRALDTIQPLHAHALKLRNLEGFSHKEIAEQLNISPMQVKALLHRARLSFKRAWDNASGWALAPVLAFRSLLQQGSKDAPSLGAQLPVWTSTASPLLAERVAASAMVVVVALSGTGTSSAPTDASPTTSGPVASAQFPGAERATSVTSREPDSVRKPAEARAVVADLESLLEEVREKARPAAEEKRERKKDDNGGDSDIGPGSANRASQKLVEDLHGTAEDIEEALPDR